MTYKRIYGLLLLLIFCRLPSLAQRQIVDSLSRQLAAHPARDSIRLGLLNDLGWAYRTVDPAKGIATADSAIILAQSLKDMSRLASAYNTRAWNYSSQGRDALAIGVFSQALAIRARLRDSTGMAKLRYNIGIMYFNLSDYPKALQYQQNALAWFVTQNDLPRMANSYNAIGLTYQYVSEYPKALDCFLKTLSIYQNRGDSAAMPPTLTNIGILYKDMHQYDKALEFHQRSLQGYRNNGDQQGMALCLGNIGVVYDEQHQPQKALDHYRQALAISQSIGYRAGIASNLTNIGSVYAGLHQDDKALDSLDAALAIWREIGDKNNEGETLAEMGKIYAQASPLTLTRQDLSPSQRSAKAHALLQQALTLAQEIKSPSRQQAAWQYLAEIAEKEKDYPTALHAWQQATRFRDSVTNTERAKEMTRKELEFEFERQQTLLKANNDKREALAQAALNRQILVRNSILAGLALVFLTGLAMFVSYKKRRDAEAQQQTAEAQKQAAEAQQQAAEAQQQAAEFRQQTAEFRAESAETEAKALRAQMNPHFIFNSLNSISAFIAKNDTQQADLYLTRFAQLMRLILENSEWTEISLADDLKALEIYMQLENLRLNQGFTYEITVSQDIDKENTLVPPLLLQPFVENSIWHGISAKPGEGRIKVQIDKHADQLHCTVTDNGPGLPLNGSETSANNRSNKSFGKKITTARIDLLNRTKDRQASVRFSNATPQGLRVELILPLETRF